MTQKENTVDPALSGPYVGGPKILVCVCFIGNSGQTGEEADFHGNTLKQNMLKMNLPFAS